MTLTLGFPGPMPANIAGGIAEPAMAYGLRYMQMRVAYLPTLTHMKVHEAHHQRKRKATIPINEIILHATESGQNSSYDLSLRYLKRDNSRGVSAHYLIGPQAGQIAQLVHPDKAAIHAGISDGGLGRRGSHNDQSIGIELFKKDGDTTDYSRWQYEAVAQLCLSLMMRYGMTRSDILAHAATSRCSQGKLDPRNFRWDVFDRLIEIYNERIRMAFPDMAVALQEVDRPDFVFNPMKIRRRRRRGQAD